MSARAARPADRAENATQVVILLAIGGMAGAASFTHMHNWTIQNSPAGTGEWFGWANAVISELTPLAAGLEARRRRRTHTPAGYPIAVLIVFAGLSLAAQFSQATPSVSGWLLAGLPAIGFLALIKLVLATPATLTDPAVATEPQPAPEPSMDEPGPVTVIAPVTDAVAEPLSAEPSRVAVRPAVPPIPVGAFTRVNGTRLGGA